MLHNYCNNQLCWFYTQCGGIGDTWRLFHLYYLSWYHEFCKNICSPREESTIGGEQIPKSQ